MNQDAWFKKLESDIGTQKARLIAQMRIDHPDGKVEKLGGAFKELSDWHGYIQEITRPESGGTFVKLYGCSYLFPGYPDNVKLEGIELAKALLFNDGIRRIASHFVFAIAIFTRFIFGRKRLIKDLEQFFDDCIIRRVVDHYDIPANEYSRAVKALQKAIARIEENSWTALVKKIGRFICLFLELDTSYRFRLQDGTRNTLWETMEVLLKREAVVGTNDSMLIKWGFWRLALKIALFLAPGLNRIVGQIFANIDLDQFKLDEAEGYFALGWQTYNFGGLTEQERFALRGRIDREKSHIFLV